SLTPQNKNNMAEALERLNLKASDVIKLIAFVVTLTIAWTTLKSRVSDLERQQATDRKSHSTAIDQIRAMVSNDRDDVDRHEDRIDTLERDMSVIKVQLGHISKSLDKMSEPLLTLMQRIESAQ
ncbi:MAG: hypothetical protein AAF404_08980, partial [Pseudomonadota bacterium]